MNKYKPNRNFNSYLTLCLTVLLVTTQSLNAQISFNQSNLNYNGFDIGAVTSMTFGPDDRLYVVEYTGAIKILTIERISPTTYNITDMEVVDGIKTIQDHNDNGAENEPTLFGTIGERETIGIAMGGTATNPVFYVSSSDIRIGAGDGGGNGDVGLDTNSGIITRFSWNGTSWDVVDIVRGLPRSEENHATNGLDLAVINGTNYLIVAQGGHTNGGSPSTNFVFTCEYALSGAVLAIDLDAINTLPVLQDQDVNGNTRDYIYDLPTLDDPTRPNVNGVIDPDNTDYNGVDVGDPFGGNDGLNMAIIDPLGPVQILSPGYRNAYDLVVTESGALYVTDNGANQGWGGFPSNEGNTGTVTNEYFTPQPGDAGPSDLAQYGEFINNLDHLQLVTTNLNNYTFNSLYGGHPNPIRANPMGAGLYTDNTSDLGTFGSPIWRTAIYDPSADGSDPAFTNDPDVGLPANWNLVVPSPHPVEGDWRGPGIDNPDGPDDNPVVTWGTNTNSLAEYTASNFNGAMQGNLLAGHSGGNIRRVILSQDGSTGTLTPNFFSGIGGNALGLTCNGDNDIFPGTVWTGTFNGQIIVFEPADEVICTDPTDPLYNPLADYDGDGYTNEDEVDNETDPCSGGSQPADFDKLVGGTLVSDLNDTDDDSDGIPDSADPFQLGNPLDSGSDAFTIPISNDLFNDQQGLGGVFGLGMTGLMNNGDTGANWLNWLDRRDEGPNPNDVLGGAPGIMTSHMTAGTALGTTNTQEKGYQYGVQVDSGTRQFTVVGGMNGFSGGTTRLYGNTDAGDRGELGFFIGDGTQSNYIKFVVTVDGFTVLQEINDIPQPINGVPQETEFNVTLDETQRPTNGIRFYFIINPSNGEVTLEYQIDENPRVEVTTVTAQGNILTAIQQNTSDLAVGFIGTSGTAGVELEGSWDFLNVLTANPFIISEIPDIDRLIGSPSESLDLYSYFNDDGGNAALTFSIQQNTDTSVGATINGNILDLSFPSTVALSSITVRATDADNNFVEQTFIVNVLENLSAIYRINTGGPEITAIDGGINWSEDTGTNNSNFLSEAGTNSTSSTGNINNYTAAVDTAIVPIDIFETERSDLAPGVPNVTYTFPVANNGNYEVRLYMGNQFPGTAAASTRIFNVTLEGKSYPELTNIDLSGTYGHEFGTMISYIVPVSDNTINISLLHDVIENPLVNGIEILEATSLDTPIYVFNIEDQVNFINEALDGSLGVVALGGDGNLQFSATGLPPGVFIEPTNGQIGGTIDANADANSPYNVTITIDDSDTISSDAVTLQFTWTINELLPVLIRVNAGGLGGVTYDGKVFSADEWFLNGKTFDNTDANVPSLFQTERSADPPQFEYAFSDIPNGNYEVILHFAEIYFGAPGFGSGLGNTGNRVFDVDAEGIKLLDNYDIIADVGPVTEVSKTFLVSVTDGELNLLFDATGLDGVDQPKVSAIEVLSLFDFDLIYNDMSWIPSTPDETTTSDSALILNGDYTLGSDIEVNNLNLRPGTSVTVEAGKAITTNGDINAEGTLELQSTSSSYASLIANGAVNGNVIYERHVNNNDVDATGSNDLIAAPLSGQAFVDFLSSNPNIVSNSDNTLYLFGPFNKTNGTYDVYAASETATLDAGIGYRAASTDKGTFTFTGTVNTGPIATTILNSGPAFQEWNLIGNPYPSYLDTGAFLSTNISAFGTNSAAVYGYDGVASDGWVVWNLATAQSQPEEHLITPGQGFFVASQAATGSVSFLPSMRVKGQSDDFIDGRSSPQSLPAFLKLGLSQNDQTYHTDFYFNPNASRGLDKGYDAQVWGGNAAGFSLHSYLVEDNTGLPMAIQSLGETDYADVVIPLGVNANLGEQIRIGISEHTMPATVEVYLEDRLNQTVVLLNTGDYVLTPSSSLDNGRFFLRFNDSSLSSQNPTFDTLHVFSDAKNQSIVISGLITEPSTAKLFDVQGREVISSALRLNTSTQTINVGGLEKGVYIISIASVSEKMTQKLIIR